MEGVQPAASVQGSIGPVSDMIFAAMIYSYFFFFWCANMQLMSCVTSCCDLLFVFGVV